MARRAFAGNLTLAVVLLQAFALAQEPREGLSTPDPAHEGFSVLRQIDYRARIEGMGATGEVALEFCKLPLELSPRR